MRFTDLGGAEHVWPASRTTRGHLLALPIALRWIILDTDYHTLNAFTCFLMCVRGVLMWSGRSAGWALNAAPWLPFTMCVQILTSRVASNLVFDERCEAVITPWVYPTYHAPQFAQCGLVVHCGGIALKPHDKTKTRWHASCQRAADISPSVCLTDCELIACFGTLGGFVEEVVTVQEAHDKRLILRPIRHGITRSFCPLTQQ